MANINTTTAPTFKKRTGTTDRGKKYEDLMVANLILQLVNNDRYPDFKISSNNDSFGAFDDVILELEGINKVRYAVQLKHSESTKTITLNSLEADSGNFSIKKYFDSYKKEQNLVDFKLILYTNRNFNPAYNTCINMEIEGEKFKAVIVQGKEEPLLITNQNSQKCYQFEIVKNESFTQNPAKFEDFFKVFYLYPNQANVDSLENNIPKKMCEFFSCKKDLTDKYLKYINKWSELDGEKEKLTKKMMQERLALYLTASSIHPIVFGPVSRNGKILQDAIAKFTITVFNSDKVEQVKRIWSDVTDNQLNLKVLNLERKTHQITAEHVSDISKLSDVDCTSLLWLMDKCPLIVNENSQVYEAIKLCKNKMFVIITDDNSKNEDLGHLPIFKTISDLAGFVDLSKKLLENFNCLLPGMTVNLKHLIQENVEFQDIITTNDLLDMVDTPCKIPWEPEKLLKPYITRSISCPLIDMKYLDSIDTTITTIVISNVATEQDRALFKNFELMNFNNFLNGTINTELKIEMHGKRKIYFSENVCSQQLFESISKKTEKGQNHHHFKLCNGSLRWMKSTTNIYELRKFILKGNSEYVKETEVLSLNEENNIHLIADGPGIGKTWLMKSIKNRISPNDFTIYFTVDDILQICQFVNKKEDTNLDDFIIDLKYSKYNNFAKSILKLLMTFGKVVYIWDALDETASQEEIQTITNIIDSPAKNKSVHWLTCRSHLKSQLEHKFNVLSKSISHFTDPEQSDYIKKRLSSVSSPEELQEVAQKIRNNIAFTNNEDILGIPLQIFMITELFLRDTEKYCNLNQEIFCITDLYKYFVEEKIKLCLNQTSNYQIKQLQHMFIKKYQKIALRLIADSDFLKELNLDHTYLEDDSDDSDSIGIVAESTESTELFNKKFIHISYAEYFVATYFAQQIRTKKLKFVEVLPRYIFQKKYTNVRFFFDLLLANHSPAHIAVMYKNIKELQNCDEKMLLEKDTAGRNVLQIACSWGERYPILDTRTLNNKRQQRALKKKENRRKYSKSSKTYPSRTNLNNEKYYYVVENEIANLTKRESLIYVRQLEFLLEKCDFKTTDDIFQLDALQYAEKCECFYTIAIIDINKKCDYFKNKDCSIECSLLYYSIKFGYNMVFDLFANVKYVETNFGNLLHVAVENNQDDCLDKLLFVKEYKERINFGYNGVTALFLASSYGRLKMTRLLLDSGANFSISEGKTEDPLMMTFVANERGWNPLHVAAFYGYENIVEQLLCRQKDNVNAIDADGFSAIHSAAGNRHEKIVELLIKRGVDVNAIAKYGWTVLHIASQNGHDKIARLLIKAGVDINAVNVDSCAAVHMASYYGHHKVVELLIKSGADINAIEKDSCTALHLASHNGHDKVAELLIKSGADINAVTKGSYRALHIASQNGHDKVVKLLVKSGVNVNAITHYGMTALHFAAFNGHCKVIDLLITIRPEIASLDQRSKTASVEVDLGNANATTALIFACCMGHYDTVKLLLESGSNVNSVDYYGVTALGAAIHNKHKAIVQLLIAHGADKYKALSILSTPLYQACEFGVLKLVKSYIKMGANMETVVHNGWRAIHIACFKGFEEIVKELIKAGANVNIPTKAGDTPAGLAGENGHKNIVRLIDGYLKTGRLET